MDEKNLILNISLDPPTRFGEICVYLILFEKDYVIKHKLTFFKIYVS